MMATTTTTRATVAAATVAATVVAATDVGTVAAAIVATMSATFTDEAMPGIPTDPEVLAAELCSPYTSAQTSI